MRKCHLLKEGKLVFKPGLAAKISGCLHNIRFFQGFYDAPGWGVLHANCKLYNAEDVT